MKITILGRQPEIGIAELESVFGGQNVRVLGREAAIVKTNKLNVSHFGSILKSGEIVFEVNSRDWRAVSKRICEVFIRDFSNFEGKITLGISAYQINANAGEINQTLSKIKSELKKSSVSVRTISSKTTALSTAI